jgi:hypothetical protein
MSDFNVARDDMAQYRLSDTDIDALIDGEPVEGAPAQLTELMVSLRSHADLGPSVPVSAALSEFIVTGTTGDTQPNTTDAEVISLHRHRISRLTKAASIVGLAPLPFLIGATMAAAAAVGGAHVAGIVDIPLLPDHGAQIEVVAPPEPDLVDPVAVPSIAKNEPTLTVAVPPASARPQLPVPSSLPAAASTPEQPLVPDISASAGDHATAPTLPSEAAVEGTPGCELGQDTADTSTGPPVEPNTTIPNVVPVPEINPPVNPCDQASSTTRPIIPSDIHAPSGAHVPSDVTIPPTGQQPDGQRPDVPTTPVTSPRENVGSPVPLDKQTDVDTDENHSS